MSCGLEVNRTRDDLENLKWNTLNFLMPPHTSLQEAPAYSLIEECLGHNPPRGLSAESPRRSGYASPRRASPNRLSYVDNSLPQLVNSLDKEPYESLLDSVPEREWRLLATLAKKRAQDVERDKLADEFRKMWEKEKIEREMVEQETITQYKRYINEKRKREQTRQEYMNLERMAEDHMKRMQLIDYIRHKEQKSANVLADVNDRKSIDLLDKAIEEHRKLVLAADRRSRTSAEREWSKQMELMADLRKVDDARRKRNAMLRDASKRLAITNALNSWESNLLKEEVSFLDEAKRAHYAAHSAFTDAKITSLARAREYRQKRARKVAELSSRLREAVRTGQIGIYA